MKTSERSSNTARTLVSIVISVICVTAIFGATAAGTPKQVGADGQATRNELSVETSSKAKRVNKNSVLPSGKQRLSAQKILTIDPSFVALSPEESDWLDQNGYLTREEMRAYQSMPIKALEALALQKGDNNARTALGIRHLRDGEPFKAMSVLNSAISHGSLSAVEWLATAEKMYAQQTLPRNPVNIQMAEGFYLGRLQQAANWGDHRARVRVEKFRQKNLEPVNDDVIQGYAKSFSDSSLRVAARGTTLGRRANIRPNGDKWSKLDQAAKNHSKSAELNTFEVIIR